MRDGNARISADDILAADLSCRRNTPRGSSRDVRYDVIQIDDASDSDSGDKFLKLDNDTTERRKPRRHKPVYYDTTDEDGDSIQQIIGIRDSNPGKPEGCEEPYYYVKWKDKSYKHCSWLSRSDLLATSNGENLLRRRQSRSQSSEDLVKSTSIPSLLLYDESDVNQRWFEIDRIIDDAVTDGKKEYLVKWKSLDYDEATWEKEEDIEDKMEIELFLKRLGHSNACQISPKWVRPGPDAFVEITEPPQSKDGDALRDYQLEGMNWLRFKWFHHQNTILADEMGLGKTAQIVATLSSLTDVIGCTGPFLVVAPMSTLQHWKYEFERWSDLNVVVYHGSVESRTLIQETEFSVVDEHGRVQKNRVQFDVLVTNYETLLLDISLFTNICWRYLVIDEAHRIKNYRSKIYQAMEQLVFEHCTLLTGTPIQNCTEELWSLLHFLDPDEFDNVDVFLQEFGDVRNAEQVARLHELLKKFMLRRKKGGVEKSIAPKEETIIAVELTRVQKTYYKAFLQKNAGVLLKTITNGAMPSLSNLMMQLRKVCNHPFLIKGVEEAVLKDRMESATPRDTQESIEFNALVESSGKLVLIDKLLPKLREEGHKVLIFSQMVRVLNILEEYLNYRGYTYERIDGSCSASDRQSAIERFGSDNGRFVFLLCTKAGGVGINLTAADVVIIYDSDWNPQNDIQAQARCHRIGQKSTVKVYRLITRNTYENEMFERASRKLALDHAVMDGGEISTQDETEASELEHILRRGVYSVFGDDDHDIDSFCAEDIEQILQRRTRTHRDVVAGGDSVFSHASFQIDANDNLDMNSQDFWKQVLKPDQTATKEDDLQIRQCRKVQLGAVQKTGKAPLTKKIITNLIKFGFRNKPNELLVLQYAVICRQNETDSDTATAKKLLQAANASVEGKKSQFSRNLGNLADTVEYSAADIINSVALFYRLGRVLTFLQKGTFSWPTLSDRWESPVCEYAFLLLVYRHGIRDPSKITADDTDLEILTTATSLTSKAAETRLRQLIDAFEMDIPLNLEPEDDESKFLPPKKLETKYPDSFRRLSLCGDDVASLINAVLVLGLPLARIGQVDIARLIEEAELDCTREAAEAVLNQIIDYSNGALLEDLPLLQCAEDRLQRGLPGEIVFAISELRSIHEFVLDIHRGDTTLADKCPTPATAPKWWSGKYDIALIRGLAKHGRANIKDWILDPSLPFSLVLTDGDIAPVRFLCRWKPRIARALEIIDHCRPDRSPFPLAVSNDLEIITPGVGRAHIGHRARRFYPSIDDTDTDSWYEMTVTEGPDSKPLFTVSCGSHTATASDPQKAWASLLGKKPRLSGVAMFGLNNPRVYAT